MPWGDCMCPQADLHELYGSIGARYAQWLQRAVALHHFCCCRKNTSAGDTTLDRVIRELDELINGIVE